MVDFATIGSLAFGGVSAATGVIEMLLRRRHINQFGELAKALNRDIQVKKRTVTEER